ncbi:MAG: energy transducer TonB [Chitinophagaceae bacterium]|nr:energy transducer TonB [Chitinophagaceae bacterium]
MQQWISKIALALLLGCPALALAQKVPADSSSWPLPDSISQQFKNVDQPAEYPGGVEGWRRYMEANLQYPKKAVRRNTQGVARVQFLVDTLGRVSDVSIIDDPGDGLGEEAMRIIRESGRWIPAMRQGRKVRFRHIQAITFRLE